MLAILPDIHAMSSRGEEYLYFKHLNGCAPTQTLLMEMLHAKRKWGRRHFFFFTRKKNSLDTTR